MQFNKLVAMIAILGMGLQAYAQTNAVSESQPTQGVVILNTNTNTNSASNAAKAGAGSNAQQSQTATQIPTTTVEANPVSESRAEAMRRARQNAELNTEQKIVEKLEESRLREENERAERLFGNKLEGSAASATATAVATPNGAAAAATATAVTTTAPAVVEPVKVEPVKEDTVEPTVVNIEKVEIVTPVKEETTPAPVSSIQLEEPKKEGKDKFYVSPILGVPSYSASNVKSNYALGIGLGSILKNDKIAIEGTFLYSNHTIDTFWIHPVYNNLDQYDISASAKYYVFPGPLRPFAGVSMTYIYRQYQGRVQDGFNPAWQANPYSETEETHAVNVGLLAGADFALNDNVMIGAGMDWNFNIMNKSDFNYSAYNLPQNSKPLEEIDYYTLKLNAKISF